MTKLSLIAVGTVITIKGRSYEVVGNKITSLDVKKGGIVYNTKQILPDSTHDTDIQVLAQPQRTNLTDSLKKQLGKQNLTDSFRQSLEQQNGLKEESKQLVEDFIAKQETKQVQEALNTNLKIKGLSGKIDAFQEEIEEELEEVHEGLGQVARHVHQVIGELDSFVDQTNSNLFDLDCRITKFEQKEQVKMTNNFKQQLLDQKLAEKSNKPTGGINVKNILGQFKGLFGKVEGQFAFAATGSIAMRKGVSNEFVTYDKASGSITDVSSFVLDFKVPAFRLPVEAKEIKVGDIVVNNGVYGYVTQVVENGEYVKTINPAQASQGTVIPVTNFLFGKPFYTVVTTIDAAGQGGFNPALLLAMGDGKKDDILPFLLMSGGLGGNASAGGIDPTMLMLLGDNVEELLPFLLLQQGGIAQEGFNPLMLLALSDKGGSKKDSLLPLLLMGQGGQQAGGINPMMLMALGGDSDIDPMMLMAMSGGFGGGQGLFGSPTTVQAPAAKQPEAKQEDTNGNA